MGVACIMKILQVIMLIIIIAIILTLPCFCYLQKRLSKANSCSTHPERHFQLFCVYNVLFNQDCVFCAI